MTVLRLQTQIPDALPEIDPLVAFYSGLGRLAQRVAWSWPIRRGRTRMRRVGLVTYWVVPGSLMAGTFPGSANLSGSEVMLSALVREGVRAFIDLTEPDEATRLGPLRAYQGALESISAGASSNLCHSQFPIRDKSVPTRGLMTSILDTLDAALGRGAATYVHCLGGRGRTGTVIGCYLVRHAKRILGATPGQDAGTLALARITELRAAQGVPFADRSPETRAQKEFVLGWEAGQ